MRRLYKEDCLFAKGVTSKRITEALGGENCVLEVKDSKDEFFSMFKLN